MNVVLATPEKSSSTAMDARAKRLQRMVDRESWRLSAALADRSPRLLDVPTPEALLQSVIAEAQGEGTAGGIVLTWQPSKERPEYFRLVAQVKLSVTIFDQFINGRSGYRAQYYLSPEEGILYNRDAIEGLWPALKHACTVKPLGVDLSLVERSAQAPHSKIWVFEEKRAFKEAVPDALSPPRWVENSAALGRRAPLPDHLMIDVKGTFIHPETSDLFVDDLKMDRAWDIFRRGFT